MKRWKWFVLGEEGWTPFTAGFCREEAIAVAQTAIFRARYPRQVFRYGS